MGFAMGLMLYSPRWQNLADFIDQAFDLACDLELSPHEETPRGYIDEFRPASVVILKQGGLIFLPIAASTEHVIDRAEIFDL